MVLIPTFLKQVIKTPDNIAASINNEQITYREMDEHSNCIAYNILKKRLVQGHIALFFEQGIDMITAVLSVLKAGMTYIPLSDYYPDLRMKYILEDSRAEMIITNSLNLKRAQSVVNTMTREIEIVNIDDITYKQIVAIEHNNTSPNKIAYILYTSGSTGKPKGVMQTQKNILHFARQYAKRMKVVSGTRMTLFSSFCHDAAVVDIFSGILHGATLYPKDIRKESGTLNIAKWLIEEKINIWHSVPTLYRHFVSTLGGEEQFIDLRYIVLGGEKVIIQDVERFQKFFSDSTLVNLYGQTESSYNSSQFIDAEDKKPRISLGEKVDETEIFVVDENDEEVMPLNTGEIVISSPYVALGYWNEEEASNVFYSDDELGSLYWTGDMGRLETDGTITWLGRKDMQVKIRGYRVEPGDIENCISEIKNIKDAVVVTKEKEDGEYKLIAYYTTIDPIAKKEIKKHITDRLPDYMIPHEIIEINDIPLTASGKVNRKKLLELEMKIDREEKYEEPRDKIEAGLVKTWEDILGIEKIGINDNFFELGGNSLKATILSGRIQMQMEAEIGVIDIFESPSIRELAEQIRKIRGKKFNVLEPLPKKESYPVSSAQKRQYAIQAMDKESIVYNMPLALELKGNIDRRRIEKAIGKLISKHESLRTSFYLEGDDIVQKINEEVKLELDYAKVEDTKDIDKIIEGWIKPFDLGKAPLMRAGIVEKDDCYILMMDMHHIISDGTTMAVLAEDFMEAYKGIELGIETVQYKEYAVWEKQQKEKGLWDKQKEYWKKEYEGEIPVLELPMDGVRGSIGENKGDVIGFEIEEKIIKKLKERMSEIGGTLYMGLMSGLNILLSKYSGQDDIVIGTAVAGRRHPQMERVAGMFVNTLAIRSYPVEERAIEEYLRETKQKLIEAYENQEYPYEELIEEIGVKRDLSRNPLFDVILVLQNTELKEIKLPETKMKLYEVKNSTAKFDLSLTATEEGDRLLCEINYKSRLFKKETIERMIKNYIKVLEEISINKEGAIKDIDLLEKEEKERLLYEAKDVKLDYQREKTIQELFEEQVEKTPNNIAVVYGEEKITYKELNTRANKLARVLKNKGVNRDSIVGIMLEPSLEMIIGIMAILKSGGAYLPIDSYQPEDRIAYILKDSKAQIVVTSKELINKIDIAIEVVNIDDQALRKIDGSNLEKINKAKDLAYIIYTSGSTGKPKGVMIEHQNVMGLMANNKHLFNFSSKDTWSMFHSYAFDFSVWEMYGALLYGGKLVVIPKSIAKDTRKFLEVVEKEEITVLNQTPSAFYNLINEEIKGEKRELKLRYIIFGGEALNPVKLKVWKKRYPNIDLVNMYGITETTVHVTFKKLKEEDLESNLSNIGKAIPSLKTYIMDKNLKLLPIGIPGEICVGGEGVARGYLNREKLTEEKFVANPYKKDERIYKSGDLGRLLENEEIEYMGRIDNQVKIRGYRIELGEIENVIRKQAGVREIVVLAREDKTGDKYLCGFIVKEEEIEIERVRDEAKKELPEYMIPGVIIEIDSVPLTNNGKIDRKALLNIEVTISRTKEYEAPRNEIEEKLVEIWTDILGVEIIGIHDNFFELGGHSLKATILSGRIQRDLEAEVGVIDIFQNSTIKELGEKIRKIQGKKYEELKPLEKMNSYPVSSPQKRLYAIQMMDKKSTLYNMPMILELKGKIDREKIERGIKKLIKKHEAFRTSFHMEEDTIVQRIEDNININIEYKEVESKEIVDRIIGEWIKPFDLEKAPLMRGGIIKEGDRYLLMLDMHHIISDGTTMTVLEKDFVKAYEGEELRPQAVQYKEYAQWEKIQRENGNWEMKKQYWKKEYEGEIPVLELPLDRPRGKTEDNEGECIEFEIGEEILTGLKEIMMEVGGTLYMGLMAGYSILLSKYSGQEDLVIGSPIAGRRHVQMEDVAGMFINTLAIRTKPQGEKKIEKYLKEIKYKLLYAYENQEYPYEELVDEVNVRRDFSRNPLFDVMLILQNINKRKVDLSEFKVKPYEVDRKKAKFDITLIIQEDKNRLMCTAEYKSKLYNKETIKRMMKHYVRVLKEIGESTDKTIKEIELLDLEERSLLLDQYNSTEVEYDKEKTIIELFEEQVEVAPDGTALVYGKDKLTYKELNQKANQLAWRLRDRGVKPEKIVGIMAERSLEMMIGILAILKSGGAYLPIDPEYPDERISYMLEDSGAEIVLITKGLREKISLNRDILTIEDELKNSEKHINPKRINKAVDLAYIIYTSGSTGRPKGVMLEHMPVHNFIKGMTENIAFKPNKAILALTTICFDIFLLETLLPLTKGMRVVIASEKVQRDPKLLAEAITRNNVNMLQMTPSRLQMLMNSDSDLSFLKDIEEIMIGGEAFPLGLLRELQGLAEGKIYNMYGPTETTVWSTIKEVTNSNSIDIGKPIANTQIYIVDKEMRLQPTGVPGELCIGGDGLARGYFKRLELTAEKFVEISFKPGEKMYRTGDLARWLPGGNIEFLGRTDHQVKLRGYRIELEEIESAINAQDAIKESIVIVKGDSSKNQYLCAYLVGERIDVQSIKSSLKKKLPGYMVPTSYIVLDKIPLTPNGKVDRKALEGIKGPEKNRKKIPPRNLHDSIIAEIWSEVLKLDEVYIYDDFFEIGGNSITIIQVASRIKEELEVEVSVADLMVYTTILELSEYIISLDKNTGKGFKHVFKINKSSSKKNIFILHGADADILYYRHLAKQLEDEYTVYGIQPQGLNGEEPLPRSYFQMLHDYIKEIRMVQNEGPYILAGYCIGGYLSYDIVKILEIQGDKVLALLELDQEAFIEDKHRKGTRRYTSLVKIIERWRRVRRKDKMYTLKKFMDITPKVKPMSKERQMEILASREAIHDYFASELPYDSMYCFLGYISTPTIVIKAEENDYHLFKKELWEKMHEGSLEYYEVPGGHETVLFPPYVERVSELIKDYLNRMAGEELYEEESC